MHKPRVVLVDDEPLARVKLGRFIQDDDRTCVVAEAGDGVEAVRVIEQERPDIVFLDIQMPEMDGFDVLASLDLDELPRIIFVTAHEAYAVRAFEVRALDYLLKPVDRGRFTDALDRAIGSLRESQRSTANARSVLAELPRERRTVERFLVRNRGRMLLLPVEDIEWIGAAGNYAELHAAGETYLVRGTLQEIESRLPTRQFARIHRSAIANLSRVRALRDWSHGDVLVEMNDGTELRLSRRYRDRLEGIFGL